MSAAGNEMILWRGVRLRFEPQPLTTPKMIDPMRLSHPRINSMNG